MEHKSQNYINISNMLRNNCYIIDLYIIVTEVVNIPTVGSYHTFVSKKNDIWQRTAPASFNFRPSYHLNYN